MNMNSLTLARTAGILCGRDDFRQFLSELHPLIWAQFATLSDCDRAAAVVRALCDIESRSELDRNPIAAQSFHTKLGFPFNAWRRAKFS